MELLLIFIRALLAFVSLWFGTIVIVRVAYGKDISAANLILPAATIIGLAVTYGVFGRT